MSRDSQRALEIPKYEGGYKDHTLLQLVLLSISILIERIFNDVVTIFPWCVLQKKSIQTNFTN